MSGDRSRTGKWLACGTPALAAAAVLASLLSAPAEPPVGSYIVQAADLGGAAEAVRAVGGRVTHELGIIDAVGARLSGDQVERLARSGAARRVSRDGSVRVAGGCGVIAWASPTYGGRKIEWDLTNHSAGTITLSRIELLWPSPHGRLKKMELTGRFWETLVPPPSLVLTSGFRGEPKERQIKSGETKTLKVEWERDYVGSPTEYLVHVDFAEGCSVEEDGSNNSRDVSYPALVGADELHAMDIDGEGIGVAILDTGWYNHEQLKRGRHGEERVLASYDAIEDEENDAKDKSGHGTHIASIVAASDKRKPKNGVDRFAGMAPDASLVVVRAFGEYGDGTYADVIRGIDWIVAHRQEYGIRVLNCSFSAPPRSHYWEDPINQALMRAWQAGIVVVVSAGNSGPGPMTVGVPGNLPYVITVGAVSDSYTAGDPTDDKLASFSAAGPTYEGFVKPDVLAPGGHVIGIMKEDARIARSHPRFASPFKKLFMMSGTSQAAAVVSGVAALMLQADPSLTPDDVKCGLMATARAAWSGGANPYSVFQQGAGLIDAMAAVEERPLGCVNRGLDVAADLAGTRHFGGPANRDASGVYYLMDQAGGGTTWDGGYSGTGGYPWSDGYPWADSYPWADGYPWADNYPWSDGHPWTDGYPWSSGLAEPASINLWVEQE